MAKEDLYKWMENPDKLDNSTLNELNAVVEQYPYFQTARLLCTKNMHLTDSQKYEEELGTTAVLCSDRRKLFYLIYKEEYGKLLAQNEQPSAKRGDRTEELLDSFLSSLNEREVIDPAVDALEMNLATTDYFSYIHSFKEEESNVVQQEDQKLQHHDIIDAFIEKASTSTLFVPKDTSPSQTKQKEEEKEDEGEFLTETLARIYIKQKKYEQALTIIKRLSLNFPKKSVYFAHQIRFLEMLIMNEHSPRQSK